MNSPPVPFELLVSTGHQTVSQSKGEIRKGHFHFRDDQTCTGQQQAPRVYKTLLQEVVHMDMMIFVCLQHSLTFRIVYKDIIKIPALLMKVNHLAGTLKP